MGGSEERGGYGYGGQYYPPPDPSIPFYPPPQQGAYPPIPSQDRAYPPPYPNSTAPNFYPAPPDEHDHHHHHHHHHDHHNRHHDSHHHEEGSGSHHRPDHELGQLVKLCCQANKDFSLAARYDGVVLVPSNHHDESQQWYKDMTWSTRVKDEKGFPAFALVNKATKKALKHATEELQQVLMVDYNPRVVDQSVLWTVSEDMGGGFRTIRMANNIKLNLDAFRGDKRSGGVKDGTPAVLYRWKKQENQLWKIIPL